MMDCKKALSEAEGDIDKAIHLLRERGMAKAAKRAGNETNEGKVFCKINGENTVVSMVKMTCETEPVRNTDEFNTFCNGVSVMVFDGKAADIEGEAMQEKVTAIRAKLGENITIKETARIEGDFVSYYVHSNMKIGVIVELGLADASKKSDVKLDELAKNLTLQIASLAPKSISVEDLDSKFVEEEVAILKSQLKEDPKNKNKPDNILDMIIEGRKGKIFAEACLLEQEYVKEKMQVKELVESVAKEIGTQITVNKFVRFAIGQ